MLLIMTGRVGRYSEQVRESVYPTFISAWYSSFNLWTHKSLSLGPAFVLSRGILLKVFRVESSTIFPDDVNKIFKVLLKIHHKIYYLNFYTVKFLSSAIFQTHFKIHVLIYF